MITTLRLIGATGLAMAIALALVIAVEMFSAIVHPPPPGFQATQQEICDLVARYPHWVLAVVVPMWGATAFISTWVAGRLGNRACAILIAILLMAAVLFNLSMLPYPIWFKIVQPIAILVTVIYGERWSRQSKSASAVAIP